MWPQRRDFLSYVSQQDAETAKKSFADTLRMPPYSYPAETGPLDPEQCGPRCRLRTTSLLAVWLIWCGVGHPVRAQQGAPPGYAEAGLPFLETFAARDYQGHQQNWAIIQDDRGVLYFGNLPGVLEYDGVTWRMIATPNESIVRSMAVGDDGTIYVGAHAELGYLAPDSIGLMQYHSLLDHIALEDRAFNNVWKVHATPHGIYFRTNTHLFLWAEGRMRAWTPGTEFHRSFWVEDTFYIREWDRGLMQMEAGRLVLAPGGERFADLRVDLMLPLDDGTIMIGTRTDGLYRYDGANAGPLPNEADAFLREHHLYDGIMLPDGTFAFATLRGGVAVIDRQGRFLRRLDEASGLPDNTVWSVAADRQGGLWLALNKGLARAEMPSPLSYFSERLGVEGSVEALTRHRGRLYAATSLGVYGLVPATEPGGHAVFQAVPGIATQAWSLLSLEEGLLVATSGGLYQVEGDRATQLTDLVTFSLSRSRHDPSRIYVALGDGLGLLDRAGGRWRFAGRFPGISEEVRTVAEDEAGDLWLGTQFHGVLRVTLPRAAWSVGDGAPPFPVERYDEARHDLPTGEVNAYAVGSRVVFGTVRGLRRFDPAARSFVPDTTFGPAFSDTRYTIQRLTEDDRGLVWIERGRDNRIDVRGFSLQEDGRYEEIVTPLARIADFGAIWAIYPDEQGGVVWLGGDEGIVRYDTRVPWMQEDAFAAMVRRVRVNGDSLLYGGAPLGGHQRDRAPDAPVLDYANYTIRFAYAVPRYDNPGANQYQYRLEGFEDGWSAWTDETIKDYTNLPAGDYRFHVRAKDVYQRLSSEDAFAFTILPPWYRTWWAYVLYAVPLLLAVYAVDRFQRRRLIARERTRAEIEQARLRAAAAELQARTLRAERALLKSERKFVTLAESANDAIISADHRGKIVFWNRSAEEVFGYSQAEAIGMPLTRLMPERYRERHRRGLERFLVSREGHAIGNVLEVEALRKDGSEFPVSLSLSAWETEEGVFFGAILRDITKRRQDEERLRVVHAQLAHSEKMASLGKLTAGIAHEIKNPLNFVNNFAQLNEELADELAQELKDIREQLPAHVAEALRNTVAMMQSNAAHVVRHGRRVDGIVKAMMQHAMSGRGKHQPTEVNTFVDEYVVLAYHAFQAQYPDVDVAVERRYDDRLGEVDLVPKGIGRVLLNLLDNAFYAVRERALQADGAYQPMVFVQTRQEGGRATISVRDNGTGIPPEVRTHIFEPFYTTKPTGTGTGLGLSMAYDLVTQGHGGTLTVDSVEGSGTTFVVTLPA